MTRAVYQIALTRNPLGLQGVTGATGPVGPTGPIGLTGPTGLTGAPGAAASISDTPTNNVTDVGISSNWAFDHTAAADPHPGYVLESAANIRAVSIKSGNYPLVATDSVVVFTATATATLPAATGSGRTYRIVCRAGTLTVDADGSETIKGETTVTLTAGEELVLTDTAAGVWE